MITEQTSRLPAEPWNKSMRLLFEVYLFVWSYITVLFLPEEN